MTNPNNGLFENFEPVPPTEGVFPPLPQSEPPAAAGKKRGRKKTAAAPAPRKAKVARVPKKQKSAKPDKAAPRFTMDQILLATSGLKEADRQAFDGLVRAFHAMGKPMRDRILPALAKLFQD